MIKQVQSKYQLESLRLTKTTKEGILKRMAKISMEELKELVPNIDDKTAIRSIIKKVDNVLNSSVSFDLSDITTESIIKKIGRPVFLIENNLPLLVGNEIDKFKLLLNNAISNFYLSDKIGAVGRIETDNLPGFEWLGTGWLFEEDLLITNRHVAGEFVDKIGKGYTFKRFVGNSVLPRIDFLAEYNNNNAAEFSIEECLYLASRQEHDIAIFRIKTNNDTHHLPINILNGNPQKREDVAVIGYPAFDSRTSLIAEMESIYKNIYDVKRLAIGKIISVHENEGIALHDATTLGGNSGSVVLSLETGKAVALHFAGKEGYGNYCVTSSVLKKAIDRIPRRIYPVEASSLNTSDNMLNFNEIVPRNCKLEPYSKIQVPTFKISGRFITYATPDSTFFVTQKLFESAKESILIGIYDFSAEHMITCIKDAIDRGVKISLMLDIDSSKEQEVFKNLIKYGVECVPAPSCSSKNISYFSSSHEKVIIIDNQWTLIQSGNYSNNSIPYNRGDGTVLGSFKTGNRDMGIAIESRPLAKFFTKILRSDMQLEMSASSKECVSNLSQTSEFLLEAPKKRPSVLFSSKEFNHLHRVSIQPVLSPDNYMIEIPKLIRTAKRSIKIEQQYIRVNQKEVKNLVKAIQDAKSNFDDFTVQIIVASPIGDDKKTYEEVEALRDMGFEVLMLSKSHFVHCHNKLLIIDDETVLISSQNWSDSAVSKNREAGVIVYDKLITEYYSKIFDADWTMSEESVDEILPSRELVNLEAFHTNAGKYVLVDACDVQEV